MFLGFYSSLFLLLPFPLHDDDEDDVFFHLLNWVFISTHRFYPFSFKFSSPSYVGKGRGGERDSRRTPVLSFQLGLNYLKSDIGSIPFLEAIGVPLKRELVGKCLLIPHSKVL